MGSRTRAALTLAVVATAGCNAILGLEPTTLAVDAGDDTASGSPLAEGGADSDTPGGEAGMPPPPDAGCGDACAPPVCATACGAGLACERVDDVAACLDPEWAEWPMPNSPGMSAVNPETYTDNGDGTVTDNVTKLMWQQAVPSGTYPRASAIAYCQSLNLAGHQDWRLPTQIELLSLVDYTRASPCINAAYFPNTPSFAFWSSTPWNAPSALALGWGVTFIDGTNGTNTVLFAANLRCVR